MIGVQGGVMKKGCSGDTPIGADLSPTRAGASPAPTIDGLDRLLRRMVGATLAVALALKSALRYYGIGPPM